jgi:hypothetical protein
MLNACVPESADVGLAAWTVDPATAIISASFATTVQYLAAVYYRPANDTAPLPSKVLIPNVIVGSWTNIQAALINIDQLGANSPGVTLAITAAVQAAAAGLNTLALTWAAAAPAVLPAGRYWIGFNVTGTAGTAASASNPGATSALGANAGTDLPHARFGIAAATGVFTSGTNIVPATITATTAAGQLLCAALA